MKIKGNRGDEPPLRGTPEYERTSTAQKSKYTPVGCFGWPRIFPAVVATLLLASLATASLPGASFGETGEGATSLEYTHREATYGEGFHEATSTEGTVFGTTAAPEDTSAGHGDSVPVQQYYAPPSEGTLADTGGTEPWMMIGVALASLAVLGMMLWASGLARGRAGASLEEPEDRRGGSSHG